MEEMDHEEGDVMNCGHLQPIAAEYTPIERGGGSAGIVHGSSRSANSASINRHDAYIQYQNPGHIYYDDNANYCESMVPETPMDDDVIPHMPSVIMPQYGCIQEYSTPSIIQPRYFEVVPPLMRGRRLV